MTDELGGNIMKKIVRLRAKSYSYLKDDLKGTKKCYKKKT